MENSTLPPQPAEYNPQGAPDLQPLSELRAGSFAVVRQLQGGHGFSARVAALGFTAGAQVSIVQNYGRGPMIVSVRGTRLALGRGEASRVLVEKL